MTTQVTAPLPEPPTKRLTRSSRDRVLAGVAGGFGRYVGVDPVVVRLVFIVLAFFGGAGLILYGAAWLIVPSEDSTAREFDARAIGRRLVMVLGALVLTFLAAAGGFWGFAIGGGVATALIVIVLGAMLAIGAFTGGARWLLVPAIALSLGAGVAAAANLDVRGGAGERIYKPASSDTLRPEYRLGAGRLRLDLRDTRFTPGTYRVHMNVGVGQAEVLVPDGICVSSTAHIAAGATTVFDRETGGIDHDWQDIRLAPEGTPRLVIDG